MRAALFALLLYVLSDSCLVAQSAKIAFDPLRELPVEAMQADLRLMQSALEELHPSLYWYTPKSTVDSAFNQTYAAITRPMTESAFKNLLYPAICQIRCGHTQLQHSIEYSQSSNRPKAVHLPFDVYIQGRQAWLLDNPSTNSKIGVGTELISINGIAIAELIQAGLNSWNGDGYSSTWKEFFLNDYDFFEDVCWAIYGWTGPYELRVRDNDGQPRTVTVAAKPKPVDLPKSMSDAKTSPPAELAGRQAEIHKRTYLNLRFMADSMTAVLMVNGLEYGDETFYEQAFKQLDQKAVSNLILDIRRNHGGDVRIINNLLSYLADSSYVILQKAVAKVADPGQNRFADYFDPDLNRSYSATFGPSHQVGGWYEFDFKPEMGRVTGYQPVSSVHRFRGSVYVLIDGGTFSNGSNFAAALKAQCRKAVFIGRETGGTELGCGGGTNNKLTLPHSKLVLQFPWLRLVSASRNPIDGYGVMPDYPITYTPQAIASHHDLDERKALELIKKGKSVDRR